MLCGSSYLQQLVRTWIPALRTGVFVLFLINVSISMILVNYVWVRLKTKHLCHVKYYHTNKKILSCDTFKSPSVLDFISLWFAQDEKKQFKYSNWDISRSPEKITMDWQVSHILTILIQSRLFIISLVNQGLDVIVGFRAWVYILPEKP